LKIELYQIQVALFFPTRFKQLDKISLAAAIVKSSSDIFSEDQISAIGQPDIPGVITDNPWLIISNSHNGYSLQLGDEKVNIIWNRPQEDSNKSEADFLSEIDTFLDQRIYKKDSVKRVGYIRTYLIKNKLKEVRKNIVSDHIFDNFNSFQVNLINNGVELDGHKMNIRCDLADVKYQILAKPEDPKPGINLQVDINSLEDEDINKTLSDLGEMLNSISSEYPITKLEEMLGFYNGQNND
jgi:hypothetical protein